MRSVRRPADTQSEAAWEHEIDLALQALNRAEPPHGLRERVQRQVPLAALQRTSRQGRIPAPALFGVLATVALACLLVAVFLRSHRASPATLPGTRIAAKLPPAEAVVSPAPASAAPTPTAVFRLALTTQARATGKAGPKQLPTETPSLPTQAQLDTQALADTQAPSHPAPTMELTAQERQATLMLRQGEKRNLASLDPAYQQWKAQRVQADFQSFVHPALNPLEKQIERDAQRVQAGLPLVTSSSFQSDSQSTSGDQK